MKWSLLSVEEVHAFGIDMIVPYMEKEGVTIESVNRDLRTNPQLIGQSWGSPAFFYVRIDLYPNKVTLTNAQFKQRLAWADKHRATAFFTSVGLAFINYPDKPPVKNNVDMRLPFRNAGFPTAYDGIVVMATPDRVQFL